MQKLHYFEEEQADPNDHLLNMAKQQGYVPQTCLLAGMIVIVLVNEGKDPCFGCACDRSKCKGRRK